MAGRYAHCSSCLRPGRGEALIHASVATAIRVPAPEYVFVASCVRVGRGARCVRAALIARRCPRIPARSLGQCPANGRPHLHRVRIFFYCAHARCMRCDRDQVTLFAGEGNTWALCAHAHMHPYADTLRCPRSCGCFGCMRVLCAPACCAMCL